MRDGLRVLCREWALPGGSGCAVPEPLAGEGGRGHGRPAGLASMPAPEGGQERSLPPWDSAQLPAPRTVSCRRKLFMESHLEGLTISSPEPQPRSRPRVEWHLFPAGSLSERGVISGLPMLACPSASGRSLSDSKNKLEETEPRPRWQEVPGDLSRAPRPGCAPVHISCIFQLPASLQVTSLCLNQFDYILSLVTERARLMHVTI